MQLTVTIGQSVNAVLDGHSAVNGAPIPQDATVAPTSSNPAVVSVPPTVPVPPGGANQIVSAVQINGTGSADISATVTLADGTTKFTDTATLLVAPIAAPGLTHVTLTLVQV